MPRITKAVAQKTIAKANKADRPFVVRFIKATDKSYRTMICASGSFKKEFVKGTMSSETSKRWKALEEERGLIRVFDLQAFAEHIAEGHTREKSGLMAWRSLYLGSVVRVEVL